MLSHFLLPSTGNIDLLLDGTWGSLLDTVQKDRPRLGVVQWHKLTDKNHHVTGKSWPLALGQPSEKLLFKEYMQDMWKKNLKTLSILRCRSVETITSASVTVLHRSHCFVFVYFPQYAFTAMYLEPQKWHK